ncbi:MAG: family 16 glycosylhydrolase, partial [Mycobacteriales bacterium]
MQPAVIKSSSRALLAAIAASVLLLIALPFSGAQSTGAFNVNFNTGSIPSQFVVDTGSAPASSGSNSGSFSAANCELNQGMLALKVTQSGASPVISTGCEVRTSAAYGYGTYSVTMRASSTATTPNGAGSASDGQISTAFTFINNSLTEIDMPEIEGTGGCGGAGSCSDTLEWTNYINGPGNKQFTQTTLANPQDAFHVYKMVWQPNRIDFYVDGALATTHTQNIPTAPAYFLVSSYGTNSTSFGGDANVGVTRRMYVSNMSFVPAGTPVPPTIGTYYVSSAGGNDANSGTSPTSCGTNCGPWKTINHAITAFQLSPTGATIHVLTGTYNEATQNGCVQGEQPTICISRGGTSTLAPLVLKCDATNWTVPSSPSTGCKINFNFGSHVGISLGAANFVQIVGPFEFSGPTTDVAIIAGCDGKNPTVHTGLCPNGNGLVVDGIYAHDMGQTDGCPSTGVVSAGPSHGSNAFYNPAPIVRNSRFQHIGDLALARKNGGSCNQYHAVYLSAPNAVIENNLFLDVVSFSIHAYSYPCGTVVRNNTIVRDGASGMTLSGGDCPIAGRQPGLQTVTNNISIDAGQSGITFTAGSDSSCTSSTPNLASNNMFGGNPDGDYSLGSNPTCTTVANSLHSTGPALFVHYLGSLSQTNGNDDLHLKPGSPAIGAGTTACVPGGQSCPDANDRDGNAMSNPPPIGAYTAAVSLPTVSNYYV